MVRFAIWYHLYNSKNVKNTHGRVLILIKLQALACNFTKINTPPWVFFTFFELYKWYQIAQRITNSFNDFILWAGAFLCFHSLGSFEKRIESLRSFYMYFLHVLCVCTFISVRKAFFETPDLKSRNCQI